jgi:RNA polymerase sporulation-specific sigma factor
VSALDEQAAVARYDYLCRSVARGYYLAGGDDDDLLQEARIGLLLAARSFRPERGTFVRFAEVCIRRRVQDQVKRASRRKHRQLTEAMTTLVDEEGEQRDLLELLPAADPAELAHHRAQLRVLIDAIATELTPLERRALLDTVIWQQPQNKQADNATTRARKKLRARLEDLDLLEAA